MVCCQKEKGWHGLVSVSALLNIQGLVYPGIPQSLPRRDAAARGGNPMPQIAFMRAVNEGQVQRDLARVV